MPSRNLLRAQAGFREDQHLVIVRLGYTQDPEVWDMGAFSGNVLITGLGIVVLAALLFVVSKGATLKCRAAST
jgi:hypothetical protein